MISLLALAVSSRNISPTKTSVLGVFPGPGTMSESMTPDFLKRMPGGRFSLPVPLLQANTDTQPADESCPLKVLQQLAAKEATEALMSSLEEIILPKLLLVVMVCLWIISVVSMQG